MKTFIAATLSALTLLAVPATAQTLSTMLPTLTWPEGEVTTSTKGCTPAAVCPIEAPGQK